MRRNAVQSNNIKSVGYDQSQKVLEIEFKGGVYQYLGVPQDLAESFVRAPSVGSFFATHIKDKYTTKKVVEDAQ